MAGMELGNEDYGYACVIDNIKEAAKGNKVITGCGVTPQGTPDMTVDIAAGVISINNAYVTISLVDNQAITAADGTNDRYDIIYVGADGTVDYTAGTPATNPIPPNLPADHILLAVIFVENNSSTVESSDIKDHRILNTGVQIVVATANGFAQASTTSTTYVDTNVTVDIVIKVTSKILCWASCNSHQDNDAGVRVQEYQLLIGGTPSGETQYPNLSQAEGSGISLNGEKTGVAAGTITCKLQHKRTAAGTVYQQAGGTIMIMAVEE